MPEDKNTSLMYGIGGIVDESNKEYYYGIRHIDEFKANFLDAFRKKLSLRSSKNFLETEFFSI